MDSSSGESDKVHAWRAALTEAANIAGFEISTNRNEVEVIRKIVSHVSALLDSEDELIKLDYPVGVQSRKEEVIQLLHSHTAEHVVLMGIWGMGGVGKTIIASYVYNQIRHDFDCPMFLPNIRQKWKTNKVFLQEELLNGICKEIEWIKIRDIESGIAVIRERLGLKKVLVVLDDVNNINQLLALCGSREWFGAGSIIIITTTDRHLLRTIGVDHVYQVKELDYNESLELFSWHAFMKVTPLKEFARIAKELVEYCGGLPLALESISCSLCGKMMIQEWESLLHRLKVKRIPDADIFNVLESSFDGLDNHDKQIFLDIACFCVGIERGEVLQTLPGAFAKKDGISYLEEKSLITFDEQNRVRMHPLLRDVGRAIVQEQFRTQAQRMMYDVFVSFRGKDTRATFTSHLNASLQNAGIITFKDDDDDGVQTGENISIALLKAIGLSACSVIVLSTHYADSKWCLQELENIMLCHRTKRQIVFPIFYGVDPSDVCYQNKESDFGKAFENLISRRSVEEDKVLCWRADLREVSCFSGMTVINSRNESEDIKRIVEHVTRLLDKTELFVAAHPVGVTSRVQKVIEESNIQQAKDVLILGMKGIGGIGKTTIAKAIYNQVGRDFEGRSFLLNIREIWPQDNGKVLLQQRLLQDIFRATRRQIHNIDSGKQILMKTLSAKRILIVLDDVNNLDQLNALCGSREWFGPGSIVIITTRDDHLLRVCGVDHIFEIEEMNDDESLELFSWHAFKQACPKHDFVKLSKDVVEYSNGLPLALEVLGSYLFDRRVKEWQSVLDKLKSIPNNEVLEVLKVSYDGLREDYEKEAFLDIACFFLGMDRNDVVQILDGCGLHAEIAITVLIERSLITVDKNNVLGMHDLLRDMARAIICKESPEPENRSRLWYDETVLELLENLEGTDLKAVKGLSLKLPSTNLIHLSKEALKNMTRLKLLQLSGVQLNGEFKHISRYLRWMSWNGFPLRYTPTDWYQQNMISIELENSKLKVLWKEAGCSKIDKLEEDVEQMESLIVLKADNTAIVQVPNALARLRNIGHVSLCGYEGLARDVIPLIMFYLWTSPNNNIFSGSSSNVFTCAKYCGPRLQIKGDVSLDTDTVANCNELGVVVMSQSKSSLNSLLIQMGMENSVTERLQHTISQNNELGDNPSLLTISGEGSFVTFQVLQMNGRNLKSMMLHIIYYSSSTFLTTTEGLILENVRILNLTKNRSNEYEGDKLTSFKDEEREILISSLEPGDTVQVVVALVSGFIVKKTIVYLIYDDELLEEISKHCNDDEGDIVSSVGGNIVADVNEGALSVDVIIATDNDKDHTVFSVHDVVAGMDEIVSGVDAMVEDKDDVTVAFSTNNMTPSTNGFRANYAVETDMNESASSVDDMIAKNIVTASDMLADDNNGDDIAASGGDKNVSINNNLYIASLAKSQQVEATSTTTKTFESKSNGLISSVQVPLDSNTHETISIFQSTTDLRVNPASPVTTTMPMMVAEEDEINEDSDLLIAELDRTLSDSYILYPTSGSCEIQSVPMISIFQKIKLLLDNDLEALVRDGDIKNQLLGYMAQLGQIMESSQVPKDLHSLVTEIRHFYEYFLNDFPPVQEVLDNHQRLIDSKNGLQQKLEATKAKQEHFSASIFKGKKRVNEMSKEINELEVQLKALHAKRQKLQSTVERCEVESVNMNRKLETLVKENEEVVNTLKESESALKKAELSKESYERKLAVLKRALPGNTGH